MKRTLIQMYSKLCLKRFLLAAVVISSFICMCIQVDLHRMKEFMLSGRSRVTVDGWEPGRSRDVSRYIFPNISTTLLRPLHLCGSPAYLMIIVCSAPSNFEARYAIRESWGADAHVHQPTTKIYFLLGQTGNVTVQKYVETESEQNGDIIQERFLDSYNNLTLKSMMLLKLVRNECRHVVNFVMKTDDDMYVSVEHLVMTLKTVNTSGVLFGNLYCRVKPIRDIYEKCYVPKYMYSGEIYPNYLSGTGYVMSADVAEILFNTALHTPLLHLEDIYLTGICATLSHIKPFHKDDFHYYKIPFHPCEYQKLVTAHHYSPTEMRQLYYQVHSYDLEEECKLYQKTSRNSTKLKTGKKKKNMCV